MKSMVVTVTLAGVVLVITGSTLEERPLSFSGSPVVPAMASVPTVPASHRDLDDDVASPPSVADLNGVLQEYCVRCHNERRLRGNLSLETMDVGAAAERAPTVERMIVKLRAGMMPPPGADRPSSDTLLALVERLERTVDEAASERPRPGHRVFPRLNRAEYERSIRDLLGLEVDAAKWLPLDTKSANFDNIADVQMPSATVVDAYLNAAADISRLAVGYAAMLPSSSTYNKPRLASQRDHLEGAPAGTRGGMVVEHTFPADGQYVLSAQFQATPTGELYGRTAPFDEQLEFSVDGERVGVVLVDRWMTDADPNNLTVYSDSVVITAGPHVVSVAFAKEFEGPVNDNVAPLEHSIADTQIGQDYGITNQTHVRNMVIQGPFHATGVSENETRRRIFTCRPVTAAEARPCAGSILERYATQAYRRTVSDGELADLMAFYEQGVGEGGFENGVRLGLQAILSSPYFIFRFEEVPEASEGLEAGEAYALNSEALASRLSFFLWGAPPDAELRRVAGSGELEETDVLREQAERMLMDPRSEALATRFASQWLRLSDLDKIHPDALDHPEFDLQLAQAMKRETELFFYDLVRADRSLLDLYRADYTFLNQRLAEHYGIDGVVGDGFRKVAYPTERRSGILGHGSILTLTSHANRTSPVLRGKWVMEVLMGTPPPPPPPSVPSLDETATAEGTRVLTTRERLEMHRANPSCNSCHSLIDPIGLALDNYGVTGQWRIRENGVALDTRGTYYDGTTIEDPTELRDVLLKRPIPLIRTFTQNLMAYALGRRVEYYDMPEIRAIAWAAAENGNRMSSFILGVVESDAFRMRQAPAVASTSEADATEQTRQ